MIAKIFIFFSLAFVTVSFSYILRMVTKIIAHTFAFCLDELDSLKRLLIEDRLLN